MPAALNAANEIAVEKFINNEIKFDLIFDTIKHVMEKFDKNILKLIPPWNKFYCRRKGKVIFFRLH